MVYSKASLAKVLEELTRKAYNEDQAFAKFKKAPPKAGNSSMSICIILYTRYRIDIDVILESIVRQLMDYC